jgi:hypothetical protein
MSTSYPYNILVTKNPKVAETLFFDKFGRTSFTDAFSNLSPEEQADSLIVSPKANNSFISLTLDFPKGGSKHNFVSLKMVETNELLEYFTVSKTGFEEVITQKLKTSIALGKSSGELIDQLRKIRPSFYFSIGVGDDISEWSGPYLCELIDVNFTITMDGVREVELMFSPLLASQLVFTNKLFNDTKLIQDSTVFASQFNDRTAEVRCAYDGTYDFSESSFVGRGVGSKFEGVGALRKPSARDGWNFIVRDLIRNYLAKISQTPVGNILVLMDDDFDYITKNPKEGNIFDKNLQIFNIFELYRENLRELGFKVSPTLKDSIPGLEASEREVANIEAQIKTYSSAIKGLKQKIATDVRTFFDTIFSNLPPGDTNRLRRNNIETLIRDNGGIGEYNPKAIGLLDTAGSQASYGLDDKSMNTLDTLFSVIKEDQKNLEELLDSVSLKEKDAKFAKSKSTVAVSQFRSVPDLLKEEQAEQLVDLTKLVISIGGKIRQQDIDSNTTTVLDPLAKIVNVLKLKGNKPNDFTIFEENNYKILKALKDNDLIADKGSAVLVFGREPIVEKYLYPEGTSELPSLKLVQSYLTEDERKFIYNKNEERGYTSPLKDYQLAYQSLFKPRRSKTSSFNEKFDLGDYYNEFNSSIQDGSLLFMHNVKNANVLSLSFDSTPYKQLLLDTATESAYKVMDEAVSGGQIVLDDSFDPGSMKSLVSSIKEVVRDNSEDLREGKKSISDILTTLPDPVRDKVIEILLDDKDVNDRTNQASFLDFVIYTALMSNEPNGRKSPDAVHPISRDVPLGKRLALHANTLRNMAKNIVSVNIKTLPFFNNIDSFNRPCFLFGLPNFVAGSPLKGIKAPSFFTNNYTIIGYKHVINATAAYSEFSLIGDANSFGALNTKGGMAGLFGLDLDKVREQREEEEKQRRIEEARRTRRAGLG